MKKAILSFSLMLACGQMAAQQTVGLFLNDSLSLNGYTLFTRGTMTYLIDNCGFEVHSWESDFVSNTSVYLLENGDLLRTARVPGNPFNGGGIAGRIELWSWENQLLWAHNYAGEEYHHHHDIEPLPNGNILILAWEAYTEAEAEAIGRMPGTVAQGGLWPEKIVEVEMVGESDINVVWEWKLWDHLVQEENPTLPNFGILADHPELVDINANVFNAGPSGQSDWIHANAITYNAELDQIALSSRTLGEIWVIDHSTTVAEAAGHTGGQWGKGGDLLYRYGNPLMYDRGTEADQKFYGQHHVSWLPAGHPHAGKMMVFNNGNNRYPVGEDYSSVDIWEPPTDADGHYVIEAEAAYGPVLLTWTYLDIPGFFSPNISGAQGLPNGHVLVCEGRDGRAFEVTQSGEIVWEYINPISSTGPIAQGDNANNNSIFRATRYAPDYPAFEGRDLTPGAPLEAEPWPSNCEIFPENPVAVEEANLMEQFRLRQNPVTDFLQVENTSGRALGIQVSDWMGRFVFRSNFAERNIFVETAEWPDGMYVVTFLDENGRPLRSEKVMKY